MALSVGHPVLSRRVFLKSAASVAAGAIGGRLVGAAPAQKYFTLGRRADRWWLITPDGAPFFSLGLNHIDPSPLRYVSNGDLWTRKYGNQRGLAGPFVPVVEVLRDRVGLGEMLEREDVDIGRVVLLVTPKAALHERRQFSV